MGNGTPSGLRPAKSIEVSYWVKVKVFSILSYTSVSIHSDPRFTQETANFLDEVVVYAVRIALERNLQQRDMVAVLLQRLFREACHQCSM